MTSSELFDTPFDYTISGGGMAGLVLANSLSEDENIRVIVIEAGEDRTSDPLVLTPGLAPALFAKDEYYWNFRVGPSGKLNSSCREAPMSLFDA